MTSASPLNKKKRRALSCCDLIFAPGSDLVARPSESIGLSMGCVKVLDRAENDCAIGRAVVRVVPLYSVNERLSA